MRVYGLYNNAFNPHDIVIENHLYYYTLVSVDNNKNITLQSNNREQSIY